MTSLNKKIKVNLREIVFSNEEGKSFCDIFVYEPENIEEQSLGNLYIIGEIVNFSENSSYLINLLASIAKKEFYSNSKKSTIESLETSLHKINSMLSDLAEQGNVDWIGNLNMICGVYKNGELHLSQTGKIKTMLIRDGQITDIGKNITNKEKPHPFKTFTNIASGELENDDLVLFATPKLFDVFSTEKLKQLASSLDIEELAEIIQDSIEKENNIKTMGLLLMKIEEEKEEKLPHIKIKPKIENVQEKKSIPVLQEKTEKQQKIIKEEITKTPEKTESETPKNKEKLSLEDIISKYEKEETKEKESLKITEKKEEEVGDLMDFIDEKSNEKSFNKFLLKIGKTILMFIFLILSPVLLLIKKIVEIIKNIQHNELKSESESEFHQQTKLLYNRKKIILVLFIFVSFMLAGGLIFKNYKDNENKKFNAYVDLLIQAEEKLNKAEINSITNPPEARKSLIEAKNILNSRNYSLDNKKNYKDLSNKAYVLLKKIQEQLDIIDLVNRIENPTIAFDFSKIEDIKNPKKIFENNGKYYIFDAENKFISGINFDKKNLDNFKIKTTNNINLNNLSTSMKKTNEIIFLTDSSKIGIFNVNKKTFSVVDTKFSENMSYIKDIDSYSNFIYLLSPNSNQIYKYKRLANGFNEGQNWIEKENTSIENAVSMSIDGSIYLLNSDGLINKFRVGNKITDFLIESPSDQISASAKLYTKPEFKYLYVIDPNKNRIVLFDKINGKLSGQYISNEFSDLKNIIVDEKEKKIYILNGDKIFEIVIKIES